MSRSRLRESLGRLGWIAMPWVLVCERTGRWSAAWRRWEARRSDLEPVRVVETRSLALCRDEWLAHRQATDSAASGEAFQRLAGALNLSRDRASASRPNLLAVEWGVAPPAAVVAFLAEWERLEPRGVSVVLADPEERAWEGLAREAGAQGMITSSWQLNAWLPVARRRWDSRTADPPPYREELSE